MLPVERDQFERLVLKSLGMWDKTLNAEALAQWWQALGDLYLSDIQRGFDICLKHSRFAPRPADIRRKVTGNDGEGGTVEVGTDCSHPECRQPWTAEAGGKRYCSFHFGTKPQNILQRRAADIIGAIRAIQMIGEQRARRAFGDDVFDLIERNIHNDFIRTPSSQWTVAA